MSYPKGCDLSHYNTPVDFGTMKEAGIQFVGLKASEGAANVDPTYANRRPRAQSVGFGKILLYHFLHPTDDSSLESTNYCRQVRSLEDNEMVAIDVESTPGWDQISPAQGAAKVIHWIASTKAALGCTDGRVVIYGSPGWLRGQFGDYLEQLTPWRLWAARFNTVLGDVSPWDSALIWQNAEHGTVPGAGAAGQIDTDLWLGEWS